MAAETHIDERDFTSKLKLLVSPGA